MAAVNGGVWKTTDAGRVWKPIFDDQPTGSIGTIAIAPSDANVIYVGSGEGLHRPDLSTGDGVYKSTDAGQDVGASGTARRAADSQHRRRPDESQSPVRRRARPSVRAERGARHLSLDRWRKDVPESALEGREHRRQRRRHRSVRTPTTVYATMWEERQGPWENSVWAGSGGGIFKSVDGGTTWKPLTNGLPVVVQANVAISPANPKRLYAAVAGYDKPGTGSDRGAAGIYRSDDAGETLDADHDRHASRRADRRRRPADADPAPEGSRRRDHGEHRVVEVDRRREDVGVVQGRAWRRGLPERLDQSGQPRHHPARRRSGRGRHAQRRRDVELLVQPADRPVLPRVGGQRVSLPRLQRSAGERIGLRVEPRQLRRDLGSRLAPRQRRRVRLCRARSAQPRHRLRRPHGDAVRSTNGPGVGRRSGRRPRRCRRSQPGRSVRCARCR